MKRTRATHLLLCTGAAAAVAAGSPIAQAQSSDALLDKLVEKGVLTVKEANELREETDKDFTKAYSAKSGLPEWVTALKLNGDFRGRFEGFYADNPAFVERDRWRYRLRFGVTANLLENFEVGFRLGSGDIDSASGLSAGTDPISNNQTFQNNASKKGIFLDLAYAKWAPVNNAAWSGTVSIGKIENPFVFSDAVFDFDYTPEGLGSQWAYNLSAQQVLKLNLGGFVLDELGGSLRDPYLGGAQLRLDSTWSPKIATTAGAGFLKIWSSENLPSSGVPDINAGNARAVILGSDGKFSALGAPVSHYETLVADAAFTYTLSSFPFYTGAFPVKVFGEYLYNTDASTQNSGYTAGVTFGKAGKKRTWELTYRYKVLEGDAWWEELPDSDYGAFYQNGPSAKDKTARARSSGYWAGTNVRGHVVKGSYSVLDPLTLSVTWFATDLIQEYLPASDSHMNRVQVDAVFKF